MFTPESLEFCPMPGVGSRSKSVAFVAALVAGFICFYGPLNAAGQSVVSDRPDLNTLVRHIDEAQAANHNRTIPYSVMREYKVFGENNDRPRTQVLATVNFFPPNVKSYDIDQSTGGMGEKVVRRILDHEVDATRDPKMMLVSEENYRFDYEGEASIAGVPCYKLTIAPKHDRKDLLNATIWVDRSSFRIVRVEGEPAKSPSFWVKDVHLILDFGEVAGMWMQTETHAMAHLRFGGEYKIVSHDVEYDVAQASAANRRLPTQRRRHTSAMMAASVR
jgi:hypothetical protein